jgi:hypothetical protein
MKYIFFLFLGFGLSAFGQSIERQLYVRYFKTLYPYEPAIVRDQQMEEISEWQTHRWQRDTLTKRTKFAQFRPDGRPTFYTLKQPFGGDSLIFSFRYDSLNNLVEYKLWSPHYVTSKGQKYFAHNVYRYDGNRLKTVQLYAYSERWSMERLIQTDSLVYASDEKSVTIHSEKKMVVLKPEETLGESAKAIDRESDWKQPCKSTDAVLQPIQRFFQVDCLSDFIQYSGKQQSIFYEGEIDHGGSLVYTESEFKQLSTGYFLDTLKKELFTKSLTSIIEPTSLEDRHTKTKTVYHFSPDLRLDYTIAICETSRGDHEYVIDSIQTFYAYTSFGWQKQRMEYHYPLGWMKQLSHEGENEKPSQLPVYVMKEWMEWKRRE